MRGKVLLIAGGAAVAVLVLWFLLLWSPQSSSLDEAGERRQAAEDANAALDLQVARLRDAQERQPELTADLEQLRAAIPDEPQLAQFILDANDAAEASGVDFLSISPSEPAAGALPGVSVVGLSINVTGGYFQVLDYLNRLDDMPRLVVISSLNVTAASEGETILSVAVTAEMYTTAPPVGGDPGVVDPAATTTTTAPAGATTTSTVPGAETTTTLTINAPGAP